MHFSAQEYQSRLKRITDSMEQKNIDTLLIADPSNMCWLTGFDAWSFYVHQGVIVRVDGEVIWWGRPMDARAAEQQTWLESAAIFEYSDDHVQNPQKHPMEFVAGILRDKRWITGRVGLEMDNYYFTAAAFHTLTKQLPDTIFEDATGLANWCRSIKSPTELQFMRNAARIVERMHSRAFELIEPGMRKNDLVAEIYRTAIRGTEEYGGDYPAIVPLLPSGPEAAAAHMTWSDKPFSANEATFFEIAGVYRRYHCPLSRTIYLGNPPQEVLDTEQAILEGVQAALDVAKTGNTCEQVEAAWRTTVAKYGIEKESRIGYSTGLSYPPDWGERTMSLRPGDQSVLQEDMTFHLIPAIWKKDWGMEITETFRVTDKGGEPLCQYPRQLYIKP